MIQYKTWDIIERDFFKHVDIKQFRKTPRSWEETLYFQPNKHAQNLKNNERILGQGHENNYNEFIIHIGKKVRHENIKLHISMSAIYTLTVWNQDVNQAYIQTHDLGRDVYVVRGFRFNLSLGMVHNEFNKLYGLTQSGDSWLNKYTSYFT